MAPTGSAAASGAIHPGDELLSVGGASVRGLDTREIIKVGWRLQTGRAREGGRESARAREREREKKRRRKKKPE